MCEPGEIQKEYLREVEKVRSVSALDHYPQGGSEPGLNGIDNLYIPTSSLAICFSIFEDSGPSAETCFDTERCYACPRPAAFLSRRTRITPSTYVYTSFVSDLVLAKCVAVGKMPRQT